MGSVSYVGENATIVVKAVVPRPRGLTSSKRVVLHKNAAMPTVMTDQYLCGPNVPKTLLCIYIWHEHVCLDGVSLAQNMRDILRASEPTDLFGAFGI